MTWTSPAVTPVDGPLAGPDEPMLKAYLQGQRETLLAVCAGLTTEQLALRPVPASNLSLLGLVRHMAKVERTWFRQRATRDEPEPMYAPARGKDADFEDLDAGEAQEAVARLQAEWLAADAAVAGMAFDDTFESRGEVWSLRMMHLHMIGEYARHNGHADLLRQSIDGVTGR